MTFTQNSVVIVWVAQQLSRPMGTLVTRPRFPKSIREDEEVHISHDRSSRIFKTKKSRAFGFNALEREMCDILQVTTS